MKTSKHYQIRMDTLYYYRGELATAAYMVSRGVKPVYSFVCPVNYFEYLIEELSRCLECYDLYYIDYRYNICNENYIEIKLFKYLYLEKVLYVIEKFNSAAPEIPPLDYYEFVVFREWMHGKIFGFGDREIGEHIDSLFGKICGE